MRSKLNRLLDKAKNSRLSVEEQKTLKTLHNAKMAKLKPTIEWDGDAIKNRTKLRKDE